jgi:hypothetical protein
MSIKMNFEEWKDFIYRLNHPSQEEMEVLKETFKKCEALAVIHENNRTIIINPDINYEELDACINNRKENF